MYIYFATSQEHHREADDRVDAERDKGVKVRSHTDVVIPVRLRHFFPAEPHFK